MSLLTIPHPPPLTADPAEVEAYNQILLKSFHALLLEKEEGMILVFLKKIPVVMSLPKHTPESLTASGQENSTCVYSIGELIQIG